MTRSSDKRDVFLADTIGRNSDVMREERRIKAERRAKVGTMPQVCPVRAAFQDIVSLRRDWGHARESRCQS